MKLGCLRYKNWGLSPKLITMVFLLVVLSVSTVSVLTYQQYADNLAEQSTQKNQQIIEQIEINLHTYLNEVYRLCLVPYYNDRIMSVLESHPSTEKERLEKAREIESFLREVMTIPRDDILRVYIYNNEVYGSSKAQRDVSVEDYEQQLWYRQALQTNEPVFLPVREEQMTEKITADVFSIVRQIRSTSAVNDILGVIQVDANYLGIKSICDRFETSNNGALFVIDENQNIIYKNSQLNSVATASLDKLFQKSVYSTKFDSMQIGDESYTINTKTIQQTNWTIIAVNSINEINKRARQIRNNAFLLAIICAGASFVVLFLLVRTFLKPLFEIVLLMKEVGKGNLNVRFTPKNQDEIAYLGQAFNQTIHSLNDTMTKNVQLTKEIYQSKYLQKEAQYNQLCSQIRPHFLYNTLNTICLLIKCGEPDEAVENIGRLSLLFRSMSHTDRDETLKKSIELLEAYLQLLKSRYGEQLEYDICIDNKWMNYCLPALMLQPIVENAIVHGVETKKGKMSIRIFSEEHENVLELHVSDNGIGISPDVLEALRLRLDGDMHTPEENGVGLVNVHKRIKLRYGSDYGIEIHSTHTQGTDVTMKLPKNQSEGEGFICTTC